jgi:hypothetical protein
MRPRFEVRLHILALVGSCPGITPTQLLRHIGGPRRALHVNLTQLEREGRIHHRTRLLDGRTRLYYPGPRPRKETPMNPTSTAAWTCAQGAMCGHNHHQTRAEAIEAAQRHQVAHARSRGIRDARGGPALEALVERGVVPAIHHACANPAACQSCMEVRHAEVATRA